MIATTPYVGYSSVYYTYYYGSGLHNTKIKNGRYSLRRIKLVVVALALVVASLAAFSGPAMADDLNCEDAFGNLISCDGQLFAPVGSNDVNQFDFFNPFLNPFLFFDNGDFSDLASCPFWGDTTGVVNELDCFD
jgi:hypothetical protein